MESNEGIPGNGWDDHIAELGGGILQSRSWGQLQSKLGRTTHYSSSSRWAWQAHERKGRGIRYLYAPYGPVATDKNAMHAALISLHKAASALHADFARFEPIGPTDANFLKRHGAKQVAEVQPQRTLLLDLTRDMSDLRHDISPSPRNLINAAPRRGIRIESTAHPTDSDVATFLDMLRDTVAHNGFVPYGDSYYRDTLAVLCRTGNASLYQAFAGDIPVASAVSFDFAGIRYYAHAAAYQSLNRKHKAAVPLLWQMVTDAKDQGAPHFDFWGLAPTDDPSHPRAGFTQFKRSFGGQVSANAGTWDLPVHRMKYSLYRTAKSTLKLASS